MIRWLMPVALIGALFLAGCSTQTPPQSNTPNQPTPQSQQQTTPNLPATAERNNKYQNPPAMAIDPNKTYLAKVKTSKGDFTIELFAKTAPKTVNNFVFLAKEKFYDGVRFHRIIKDFMIQTGDPLGNGAGGPGYRFEDELPVQHSYEPGIVAMANAGPDTNGSQFFICNGPDAKSLDAAPNYTQFGKVVEGMDVILAISDTPVGPGPRQEMSAPKEEVTIQSIEIVEK